jgi:hypothetical protein
VAEFGHWQVAGHVLGIIDAKAHPGCRLVAIPLWDALPAALIGTSTSHRLGDWSIGESAASRRGRG